MKMLDYLNKPYKFLIFHNFLVTQIFIQKNMLIKCLPYLRFLENVQSGFQKKNKANVMTRSQFTKQIFNYY